MADTYSKEVRSKVMSRVKGRDTTPELRLRRALHAKGVRGWRCHRKNVPGTPDIAFGPAKLAIFVDGAFWHGHPSKYWPGRTSEYWDKKIARNQARDTAVNQALGAEGWRVLRFWDFEVEEDPQHCADRVIEALRS